MVETILITLLIVAISLVLLGVKDREAQKKPRFSIDELEKALNDSMN